MTNYKVLNWLKCDHTMFINIRLGTIDHSQ